MVTSNNVKRVAADLLADDKILKRKHNGDGSIKQIDTYPPKHLGSSTQNSWNKMS